MDNSNFNLRRVAKWVGGIALGLLFLNCLGLTILLDAAFNLLFGWAAFALHLIEENPLAGPGLVFAVAALLLFFLTARVLVPRAFTGLSARSWLIVAAMLLVLTAGLSVLALTRQVVVLANSPDPLFGMKSVQRRLKSVQNLRAITAGAQTHGKVQGQPPYAGAFDDQGRGQHGWLTYLLPYVGQQDLFDRVRFDRPWGDPVNTEVIRTFVPSYRMNFEPEHTTDGNGIAHYSLNARLVRPGQSLHQASIPDGAANTILAGEVIANVPAWAQPANWRDPALGLNKSPHGFGSPHHGGLNVSLADGSVRFLSDDIDPAVLKALSTPDGGEPIDFDEFDR